MDTVREFIDLLLHHRAAIRKFFVAVGAALGVAATALADQVVTAPEGVAIALAFLGALGVYGVTNDTHRRP